MDADTRDLLSGSIRQLLGSGSDVVSGLNELGWDDVVDDDPAEAVNLLFSEQGRSGKASAALDTVAFARLTDSTIHPLVHPAGGEFSARQSEGALVVDGVLLGKPTDDCVAASPCGSFVVPIDDGAKVVPVGGFDPESQLRRICLTVDLRSVTEADIDWPGTAAAARRALAAELVGNATAMLELATEQISARRQFNRPIGANQSPRHRLAEGYALVRGAEELVTMAWRTGSAAEALVAKAYAGHASDIASRACLQVCGAIGLTTEHPLPRYVKRARILDLLYGGWQLCTRTIGEQIVATSRIPASGRI